MSTSKGKKVAFGTQPATSQPPKSIDDLVMSRAEPRIDPLAAAAAEPEKTRRVSVDLPMPLHRQLKLHCAANGLMIADYVRDLIAKQFDQ